MPAASDPQRHPHARERMSHVDHAWLRMDSPTNLMMISGVLVFDRPFPIDRLRRVVEQRLIPIPRFGQRVIRGGRRGRGRPHWETVPEVDADRQISRSTLPGEGGEAELSTEISRLMSTPLDPDRPLWNLHLIDNYHGGSAILARLHHCIGDGVALMLVLLSLTDEGPGSGEENADDADGDAPERPAGNPLSDLFAPGRTDVEAARRHAERLMPDTIRLMLSPVEALRSARRWLVGAAAAGSFGRLVARLPDPRTPFKGPLTVDKRAAWSDPVPLAELRAIKERLGGTLNDILLTAMTGGLRRYLGERGALGRRRLDFRAAVPVNLRPLENMPRLGNEFGLVFLRLPVGVDDPVARLAELRRRMAALKRSTESVMVLIALRVMGMTPAVIQRLVVRFLSTKSTAVMTNVPGPREVLYLEGRPIKDIFFWVPQSGRVGMGISIFSYAGNARLGVATDVGLVPDPERIIAGFHEELAAMRRLAGA